MSKEKKDTQSNNVVKIKDNGDTDKKEVVNWSYLTEKELQQFKLFDAEMSKRLLLLGNTNLSIRLEQSEFNLRLTTLNALRDQQEEEKNRYQKLYEEFNKTIAKKYNIKNDKKISIDTETGLLRDLP